MHAVWIMGGIPRMAVEQKLPIKGTSYTAADIAIVDPEKKNGDGFATGAMDCPWNKWLIHGLNHSHPGTKAYLSSLAELYGEWGLDMLKVDCVFGDNYFRGSEYIPALIDELQAKGRPMLISLSPGSLSPNATLANDMKKLAAEKKQPIMARLTGDFWDNWQELKGHFAFAAQAEQFSSPLFSPDLDMLPMGWIAHVGTGPRFSLLTETEQRSMM